MATTATRTGRIVTGAYLPGSERFEHASYSRTVPAVIYQNRHDGQVIRVERDGKGGHLTLVFNGRTYDVVQPGHGVVGRIGWSTQSEAFVVAAHGALDFTADGNRRPGHLIAASSVLGDVIGEAGLYWLS